MFNGNRSFNGRQGQQIYNEELYTLYELLKHFLDVPDNPDPAFGPDSGLEVPGALWLDRQSSPGNARLMYKDSDKTWKPMYDDWFKIIKEIRDPDGEPLNPREGQLWINDSGVLNWYNGSTFVPIKSVTSDTIDFNTNAFENFLVIDPLKMTGGYIVENLSKLAQAANGITKWMPNKLYQLGELVYYSDQSNETKFYQYTEDNVDWNNAPHTSELTFEEELDSKYLSEVDLKAQYLIPSEFLDKIFVGGMYAGDNVYERISDVCIQISLNMYEGMVVAAVHVNPVALTGIKKRIIKIEKDENANGDFKIIKAGPENTEYYAFINGYGQFLNKGEDYIVKANGIQLSDNVVEMYDFIYAITYNFEMRIKNKGILYRGTLDLSNQTCIWIGQTKPTDKLLVFAQGLCLEDFYYTYDPYDPSGLLKFNGYDKDNNITDDPSKMEKPLLESKTDVAVMRFNKKTNIGIFTPEMLVNDDVNSNETQLERTYTENNETKFLASIRIPEDFIRPLVFVQGPHLSLVLGDYTMEGNKALIRDAKPGSAYYIVDAIREDGFDMYVQEGIIGSDCTIEITDREILAGECQALLFVDGFYISIRDLDSSDLSSIKVHGLTEGQQYTLLKDKDDENYQLLFDGEIAFTTIQVGEEIDDAVVYASNMVIIDGAACTTTSINTEGAISNETRLIVHGGKSSWRAYNEANDSWDEIEDSDLIGLLDYASSGYSVDTKSINILQNLGEVTCTYYAYKFANNIEKPLLKGYANPSIEVGDELFYRINRKHSYPIGENALSVWANGIKQRIREYFILERMDTKSEEFIGSETILPDNNIIKATLKIAQDATGDVNRVTYEMYVSTKNAINLPMSCALQVGNEILKSETVTVNHGANGNTKVLSVVKEYPIEEYKGITVKASVNDLQYNSSSGNVTVSPQVTSSTSLISIQNKNGVKVQGFLFQNPNGAGMEDAPTCYYIIEGPETGELKSCTTEILTDPIGINTYVTNETVLAPGVPRVYVDGYRQPQSAYSINNMNTITLVEPVVTDLNNRVIIKNEGESNFIEVDSRSVVEIEVRKDYSLREKTIELTDKNLEYLIQGATAIFDYGTIYGGGQRLPQELFLAKLSEINIFLNGACIGNEYMRIKDQDTIVLTNIEIVKQLQPGDKITFEWR